MSVKHIDDLFHQPPPAESTNVVPIAAAATTRYAQAALEHEANTVATTPEGSRNDQLNRSAFNLAQLIQAGHLAASDAWDTLERAGRAAGLPAPEIRTTLKSAWQGAARKPRTNAPDPTAPPPAPATTTLPEAPPDLDPDTEALFWDARPILGHLHTFARARRTSPWAVLGVVLARILTATPHQVCLPPIVGGRGSLNTFIGLVGPSGAGKGAASASAADAVLIQGVKSARLASGEAIAHLYKRRLTKPERDAGESEWHDSSHARLIDISEIDRFAAQSNRQGSTLMADLRAAWSGEMLGQVAADPSRSLTLEAHQYRLTVVAGIQPHRAQVLLDDADGGTPQRFVWLPVTDADAPQERPAEPGPIDWAPPRLGALVGVGGTKIDVAAAVAAEVDATRLATLRGEADPLDGHRHQSQLKVAAALGLAEGRLSVTAEDWYLASIIMAKSDATRAAVIAAMTTRATEEVTRRAERDATRAVIVEERTTDAAVRRVCGVIVRKLRKAGGWITYSDVRNALASKERDHFEAAMRLLYDAGQVEFNPDMEGTKHGGYRLKEDK